MPGHRYVRAGGVAVELGGGGGAFGCGHLATNAAQAWSAGVGYYVRMFTETACPVNEVTLRVVTTAAATIDIGIFAPTSVSGSPAPGVPIARMGAVAVPAVGVVTLPFPETTVPAGDSWYGWVISAATPQLAYFSAAAGFGTVNPVVKDTARCRSLAAQGPPFPATSAAAALPHTTAPMLWFSHT